MPSSQWFTIRAAAKSEAPTEILIYDQIGKDWFGGDGVSAKDFADALKDIPAKCEIILSINSPGGNLWDGLAIYNQLKQRREYVTVRVDGVAASIASVIALAGKSLEMPENSWLMIHDPSGMVMGTSGDMRETADLLDQHADLLSGIYATHTGKSREKIRDMMREETWMTGVEAKQQGFATATTGNVKIAASFNYTGFRRVPAVLNTAQNPPPTAAGQNKPAEKMNKTEILALLKQHGKQIAADATDEIILGALNDLVANNKVTQEAATKLKQPEAPVLINASRFAEMEANLKRERETRIRQEFQNIAVDRPFLSEAEWLPKLYADESLMANLRAMPIMPSGGTDAVRRPIAGGNSIIDDYRKLKPGAERKAFALQHWNGLEEAHESMRIQNVSSLSIAEQLRRLNSPRAANSYSATLVTDRLADGFITTIGTKLAALRGFSRDFGVDTLKPKASVQVRKATVASTTLTNATNFEQTDSTTAAVSVTVNQITQPFGVTNDELNKGHQLMAVAEKNAQGFANSLSDIWTALITVANYGAATAIGAAANFDASDLAPIYALAKNYGQKNLILDGGHLAYLLPTDKFKFRLGEEGAYNFDLISEQNRWTSATTNTVGFVCDPGAIAVCSGMPASLPAGEFIELGQVTIDSLGLTVMICHWFSRGGRVHYMTYDVMFGAAAGDTTAGEVLISS